MFEPIRGGTRGGQGEFKWSDVSADKDREVCIVYSFVFIPKIHIVQNYLGHSTNAPTGRWQKNKDIHWYSRDIKDTSEERAEEIRKIKEAEAEALSVALCVSPVSYLFSFNDLTPSRSVALVHPKRKDRRARRVQARTLYPSLPGWWQMWTLIRMQPSRQPRKQSGSGGEQSAGRRGRPGEPKRRHERTRATADAATNPRPVRVRVHAR